MTKLDKISWKLLKQIRKYPNGISKEQLLKHNRKQGVSSVINRLMNDGYLTRLASDTDRAREIMGLTVVAFTGDYILTDLGHAQLLEYGLITRDNFLHFIFGFVFGIISTILSGFILTLIK